MKIIRVHNEKFLSFRASFIVEASLALPIFIFFLLGLLVLMRGIMFHCDVQMKSSQLLNKSAVRSSSGKVISNALFLKEYTALKKNIINGYFFPNNFKTSIYDYSFTSKALKLDLINKTIPLNNRIIVKKWDGDNTDIEGREYVYIAKNGRVYHSTINCTYLKRSIKALEFEDIKKIRNASNGRYTKCDICSKQLVEGSIVYITDYGSSYHRLSNCSSLIRDIKRIPLNEVKNRKKCSKCYQ